VLEAWRLRWDAVQARDEQLRRRIRALPEAERKAFYAAYRRRVKDPDTYAVANYFFLAGLHHFYLGRYLRGAANLLAMLAGGALVAREPIAGLTVIGAVIALELPALFRSQIIVEDHNLCLGEALLERARRGGLRARR